MTRTAASYSQVAGPGDVPWDLRRAHEWGHANRLVELARTVGLSLAAAPA
jgi:hypothetical protein